MNTYRIARPAIALFAIAVLCTVSAFALGWAGASLQSDANAYSAGINLDPSEGQQFTEEQYRYMNSLYLNSDALLDLVAPLIITTLAALFVALSLLGWRWEIRRRARRLVEVDSV